MGGRVGFLTNQRVSSFSKLTLQVAPDEKSSPQAPFAIDAIHHTGKPGRFARRTTATTTTTTTNDDNEDQQHPTTAKNKNRNQKKKHFIPKISKNHGQPCFNLFPQISQVLFFESQERRFFLFRLENWVGPVSSKHPTSCP